MLNDEKKLSLELYKELGLEVRQLGLETYATNRLMLPPLVIGLLMLYGAVEKFLGGQIVISRDALYLIWFGCALISLMWICKMSRLAQLSHWHLETQRRCEYKLEVIGHRNIAHKDEKSLISKILRHSQLRFIGFGVYFALLLNFLLRSMTFNGVPSRLESIISHEVFVPWVAIINSVVLSLLILCFYFKKPFSLSSKIPKKLQHITYILILLVLLVLLISGMVFWAVIGISVVGLLFMICYLCFERRPASSSKIPKKLQHIAYILILPILSVILLNLVLINLQQEQPDPNDCLVRGLKYFAKGEYAEAIEDFNIAIELDPDNAGAYFNRGSAYFKKREFANAIVDLDKAIALDPPNQRARTLRDAAHKELENLDKQ